MTTTTPDTVEVAVPALTVPAAWLFAHRTRLVDSWSPGVEQIRLPEFLMESQSVRVEVKDGDTGELGIPHWSRHPLRRRQRRGAPDRMPDRVVFDARGEPTLDNIAHVMHNIVAPVRAVERELCRVEGGHSPITVVLPARATSLAKTVVELMGLPVVYTDRELAGRVLRVPPGGPMRAIFHEVLNVEFPGFTPDTPQRVYISRHGARRAVNEEEVWVHLRSRGFERCFFEDISIPQQWSIIRNAQTIVAIHGASLASIPMASAPLRPPGLRPLELVEVFGAGYIVRSYRQLIAGVGGQWVGVRGKMTPEIVRDLDDNAQPRSHQADPVPVDIECLGLALAELGIR